MTQEEYKELLAGHALGALEKDQARELEERLAADPELRAEFESFCETAALLVHATNFAEPSAGLRSLILEEIKQTPQTRTSKLTLVDGSSTARTKAVPQSSSEVVKSLPRRRFREYVSTATAVAAVIAVAVLAFSLYNSVRENRTARAQIVELNQRVSDTERQLNETSTQLARMQAERELLASPESAIATLAGTGETPTAKARLVFDPKTGRAMLFVEGLPHAPQGKAYQIWWITDPSKPAPGSTFETDNSGKGVLRDQIPSEFLRASTFAVTLEPETGSPAPTSKPYLISKL